MFNTLSDAGERSICWRGQALRGSADDAIVLEGKLGGGGGVVPAVCLSLFILEVFVSIVLFLHLRVFFSILIIFKFCTTLVSIPHWN